MEKELVFMAWGKPTESKEANESSFAKYTGIGSCFVHGVNLNKKELESFFGREMSKDPEYIGEYEKDGKKIKYVRFSFAISTDPKVCNEIELKTMHTILVSNEAQYNKDKTKVNVIDKYGRTCWVTTEQCKNKEIPTYSNGPANIDKDYRPCFRGEAELTAFMKTFMGIGNVMDYKNGTWVMKEHPEYYVCRLDKIPAYFNGDFSEIKEGLGMIPNNKVKILFGVKTMDDGKLVQTTYPNRVLSNGTSNYDSIAKEIQNAKDNGGFSTTEFEIADLHEYVAEANDSKEESAASTVDPWSMM